MATSTRLRARLSFIRSSRNARRPAFKALIASPVIEPEVSRINTHAQRSSGFSANSSASPRFVMDQLLFNLLVGEPNTEIVNSTSVLVANPTAIQSREQPERITLNG